MTAERDITADVAGQDSESSTRSALAPLDRRIVAALQVNPRATWRQIAAIVGRSEATVKRHTERLIKTGAVHITTFSDWVSPGFPVLVQFGCSFSCAPHVANRLAERDDVRFVSLVTGPFDVVAEMIVPSNRRLTEIFLRELPEIPGITTTTTETVLRTFKRSYDWSWDLLGPASLELDLPSQVPDGGRTPVALDRISLQILEALKEDGRASYAALASRCGISESMARYRVDQLTSKAGVRIVTIVDPQLLGYDVQLFLWLRVDLARREEVAEALAARREVRYVSATSGYSDLVCEVILGSQDDVYDFSTQVLGNLPGIDQVNMATELMTVKRGYLRMGTA